MLTAKFVCIGVCFQSWFSTTFALASRSQLDDQPLRVAGRLVADVADALDLALVDQLGDLLADDLDRRLVRAPR